MATTAAPTGSSSKPLPDFQTPSTPFTSPKAAQSAPDSTRRHSLPLHYLPPSLWSANTSSVSLVESAAAPRGEHILDEATVAHRISALRQLNGATRSRHRYAKSTGASNSTFSQPVIVRTYSGVTRPRSQQRDIITLKKDQGMAAKSMNRKMDLKLPPVEAFSFKGIMDEIKHGVNDDLERIAEICARSKYSLSNQYEVHMPPHGRGDPVLQTVQQGPGSSSNGIGPTLQAIGSDDDPPRFPGRVRGGRRAKSAAYGTLETIMSSSRSSDEDKSKKKAASEIADEVRGRVAQKLSVQSLEEVKDEEVVEPDPDPEPVHSRPFKHIRSRSATFASMMLDNANGPKGETLSQLVSPTSLISEPARPQTSTANDLGNPPEFDGSAQIMRRSFQSSISKAAMVRNESTSSTLKPPALLGSFNSWLPWSKRNNRRAVSHAEGSLRDLLKSTEVDRKGKSVDRAG